MRRCFVVFVAMVFTGSMVFMNLGCAKKSLEAKKDRISYSIGWDIGSSLKKQSIDINPDILIKGINCALGEKDPILTEDEMRGILMDFQKEMRENMMKKRNESEGKNKKEGEVFLAENKKKEGVKTTSSGLQYKVIKEGTGRKPGSDSMVKVHYEGKLIDGTVFDSSYERGDPAEFPVKGVIPGWTEALQLMKEGAEYELYIPAELAYGERGAGGTIGPNATLIFKVELISIEK